jgi:hypothetical protein
LFGLSDAWQGAVNAKPPWREELFLRAKATAGNSYYPNYLESSKISLSYSK